MTPMQMNASKHPNHHRSWTVMAIVIETAIAMYCRQLQFGPFGRVHVLVLVLVQQGSFFRLPLSPSGLLELQDLVCFLPVLTESQTDHLFLLRGGFFHYPYLLHTKIHPPSFPPSMEPAHLGTPTHCNYTVFSR